MASGTEWPGVRSNGSAWYQFGPGIVSSCHCADIRVSLDGDRRNAIYVTDPKKIDAIRAWVLGNHPEKLYNCSPKTPVFPYGDVVLIQPSITLYSSTELSDNGELIIFMPLTPLAMGMSQQAAEQRIRELRKLIARS
jgi:hypothetical protein